MSGHSKWSTIKHQKQAGDLKKGQIFTKLANALTIAVKKSNGNTNPDSNFHLRLLVEKAKAVNMPKENITRSIERGAKKSSGSEMEEVLYEGYGPEGVAILVNAATDNRARTTSEIKNIFDKYGGKLGEPGSVVFQFNTIFFLVVKIGPLSAEDIMLLAIDNNALDVKTQGNQVLIYSDKENIVKLKKSLEENNIIVQEIEETKKPLFVTNIDDPKDAEKILILIEKLEERDDVLEVDTNLEIPEVIISPNK